MTQQLMTQQLSREIPVEPKQTTLLFIDVQNFCAERNGGEFKDLSPAAFEAKLGYFFRQLGGGVRPVQAARA